MSTAPKGVHLVGSIPLTSSTEIFTTIPKALPNLLRRIPDGETGPRSYFARWQVSVFQQSPWVLRPLNLENKPRTDFPSTQPPPPTEDKKEQEITILPTRYDEVALQSYAEFRAAKERGDIPEGIRFQVSLPTPLNVIAGCISPIYQSHLETLYKKNLLSSLHQIQTSIPAKELSIQWDCPMEFIMLELDSLSQSQKQEKELELGERFKPWFENVREGIIERLVELAENVKGDVELGFHFCYGDFGHRHFIEPSDVGIMVDVFLSLRERVKRRVDWVHMPVPKERVDEGYFRALKGVVFGDTELFLGLVHEGDEVGTRRRIEVARAFLDGIGRGGWGVATECGLGRTGVGELEGIWEIMRRVSGVVGSE